jgi:hypothetical protein
LKILYTYSFSSQDGHAIETIHQTHWLKKTKIVQSALDRFLAIKEFEEMSKLVEPRARKLGFRTDEDVYEAV